MGYSGLMAHGGHGARIALYYNDCLLEGRRRCTVLICGMLDLSNMCDAVTHPYNVCRLPMSSQDNCLHCDLSDMSLVHKCVVIGSDVQELTVATEMTLCLVFLENTYCMSDHV